MKRLLRSVVVLFILAAAGAYGAQASDTGGAPSVTSLDSYLVAPNSIIGIRGTHFYSEVLGDCNGPQRAPIARFFVENGNSFDAELQGKDSANCTNTFVRVKIPASFTGAAHLVVIDAGDQQSAGGYVPEITAPPTGSLNPSTGALGAQTSIQGSGLRPASVPSNSPLTLHMGGTDRPVANWSDTQVQFDPQNSSGAVQAIFSVFTDSKDHSKTQQVTLEAGNYTFQAPSLDPGNLTHQAVGNRITMLGRNLGSGGTVTFPGGVPGQAVSWTSSAVNVTIPPGAQAGVIQARPNGYGADVAGPSVALDPKPTAMNPTSGTAGQQATISGFNFGGGAGSISVGGSAQQVSHWGDQGVTFTLSRDADSSLVTLTRADGVAVPVSQFSVVPHLDRLETNNLPAGSQVVVDGTSLGAGQGKAAVGASPAQPLLWSRDSVLVQLPTTLAPGTYPVVLTSAAGAASNSVGLTIVPGPTPKAPPAGTVAGAPVAPSFDNNHDFVKLIKPPSPVFFNITVDPHKVAAGAEADIVVTLKLNGNPVPGAAVKLAMLFTPGNDYTFTPDSGVTGPDGVFKARVKVSKNAGDSIIAATSGVFSDQDHVAGTGANGQVAVAPTTSNPAQGAGFAPLILLGVAAVGLVAAGFYLNMRSMGA
ncbi:MAG: hypothetical protein QOK05_2408 [Chloroflexota bacterium]|nr:hypothetical protein [Chloroflexota bacterium]